MKTDEHAQLTHHRTVFDGWKSISIALYMSLVGYGVLVGVPVAAAVYLGTIGLDRERAMLVDRERASMGQRADEVRDALKAIEIPEGMGAIVRTAGVGRSGHDAATKTAGGRRSARGDMPNS